MQNLPDINFVETDTGKVQEAILATYEGIAEKKLYPGDPVRLFLEALAVIIGQQRFLIDFSAKQNLVGYAKGDYLDHLGALTGTDRLEQRNARTRMAFSLGEALPFAVTIPPGTRVSPDGKLLFSTTLPAEIPAGALEAETEAECLAAGAAGNGFLPGQIDRSVDPIAHVTGVRNTTTSLGGSDAEGDDPYRNRIRQSFEKYSVAGSRESYAYWAKSAHPEIVDVSVHSPEPGVVEVRPLMKGGESPGEAVLAQVEAALDPETVVPLTDRRKVLPPEAVDYDLDLTYFIDEANAPISAQIQARVSAAVTEYGAWQRARMGRDINPSQLVHLIQGAGAKRVALRSPAHIPLKPWEVAREGSVTVHYGGLESA